MAADVPISGGVGPAPQLYEVPNAQEIIPKSVRATFDGTLAGSAFFPTVRIVSDGGVIVAEVATDTSVAAGASASVTFAPFLRAQGGGSSGITRITSVDGSIAVTNPTGPTADLSGFKPQTTYGFYSSNSMAVANGSSGTFTWSLSNGSALLDLTLSSAPLVKVAGMWYFGCNVLATAAFTAGGYAEAVLSAGDGTSSNQVNYTVWDSRGFADGVGAFVNTLHYMNASARVSLSIANRDGAASRTFTAQMYAVRVT